MIVHPPSGEIPGVSLEQFQVGGIYEVGTQVACVLVAEGWAEFVTDRRPTDGTAAPRTWSEASDRKPHKCARLRDRADRTPP